ncbi:Uncharacterized protein TCAP_07485 [Tolypocladium capitatum]|uniref:Rhodopsin domain-containing protein n=1 Tax=Tolypocladium capitatum TaxID=45235 RepID=A0A2K3PU65_9HYPO|nr:Uncharacterized protein TCAP_07485 [Tolypocladium capitatum]
MDPPLGQVRTPVDPPSSAGAVMPAGIATTAVAGVCVALRIFTRVRVGSGGGLGWEDYLVLCAMAFSAGFLFVGRHLCTVGAGLHMWDVLFSDFSPPFLQTALAASIIYAISITFSKLSLLAFYLRVFPNQASFRRAVFALVGAVCADTVAYILVAVFRCRPVAAAWNLPMMPGQCIENLAPMMVLSVADIIIDVVILCLPIPVMVSLSIQPRQKVMLTLLLATGGFVVAAAIKRTAIIPPLLASTDFTWNLSQHLVWSYVDVNVSIVCASLAALKPLLMRYVPSVVDSRLRSSQDRHRRSTGKAGSFSGNGGGGADKLTGSDAGALYSQAYELPSRDELPIQRPGADEDEARLWSRRHLFAGKAVSSRNSVRKQRDRDGSLDSLVLGDLYPGARAPVSAVSAGGFGLHPSQSTEGIKVTKETVVSFGRS